MTLSANANLGRSTDQEIRSWPVAAAKHIYRDALVGLHPVTRLLKPFEPCDLFVGIAYEEKDNSSGAASALSCKVRTTGDFEMTLSSVADSDAGKLVFATADDAIALQGHYDGFCGRVVNKIGTNKALVRLKTFGEKPGEMEWGCQQVLDDFTGWFAPVLTAGGEVAVRGLRMDSIGAGIVSGSGITPVQGANGVVSMLLDNDNEAENLTIETMALFPITAGITFEARLHLATAGGAATDDVDFGLMTASSSLITDAIRANMDVTTAGIKTAKFHLDANANDVFFGSDDDSAVVSATDTTFDNVTTANSFADYVIVARTSGLCEVWINATQRLSTTAFSVSTTGVFAGIINLEKSTGTGVPELRIERLRVAGGRA